MIASDVMSRNLVTVRPEMPLPSLAALFSERGVSGAPVVDANGCLLGMVTESDLLRRLAAQRDGEPGLLSRLFTSPGEQAARFSRSHGRTVGDVMTDQVAAVSPGTPVAEVAAILEARDIRRVPVTEAGVLLGVVSRADLLAAATARETGGAPVGDRDIRAELTRRLREQPWADRHYLHAAVEDGVVTLSGFARSPEVARALRVLAEGVPGVRDVRTDLAPPPLFMRGVP